MKEPSFVNIGESPKHTVNDELYFVFFKTISLLLSLFPQVMQVCLKQLKNHKQLLSLIASEDFSQFDYVQVLKLNEALNFR